MENELIDAVELSKILGCCPKTVLRLEARGLIPRSMRVGVLKKWSQRAILAWIDRCQQPEAACVS